MSITTLVIYIIVVGAVAVCLARWHILVWLKDLILRPMTGAAERYVGTLLYCPQCIAVWAALILYPVFSVTITPQPVANVLLNVFVASYAATFLDKAVYRDQQNGQDD